MQKIQVKYMCKSCQMVNYSRQMGQLLQSWRRLNTTGPSNAPLSSNDMSCPRVAPGQPPLLLALRSKSFTSRWQYLLNAISPHQALLDEMSGTCFKTLIIGGSRALNFYFHK